MSKGTLILGILCVAQFALLLLIYSNNDADSEYRQSSKLPASVEELVDSGFLPQAREGVEQRALAGIRIADDRDDRSLGRITLSRCAVSRSGQSEP